MPRLLIVLTDEQIQTLREARANRVPMKCLMVTFGCGHSTIKRLVREHAPEKPLSNHRNAVRSRRHKAARREREAAQ
jgi:hypothetical protein